MNGVELGILRQIDFLQEFGVEHLEKIAAVAQLVEIPEGEVIFREGEPASDIFLISHGQVSLEVCAAPIGCRRILTVGDGELLGWSPVLKQPQLSATARTLAPTQAVKISGDQILTICEDDPVFGYEFMQRTACALARRLNAARVQMLDIYGPEPSNSDDE